MNKLSNYLWGIVLIGIGVVLGLNAFNITSIDVFFDGWWTMFIIIPCFIGLFNDEDKTFNMIGFIIGVLLLLSSQDLFDFDIVWKLIVPIILISIGLSFIFKNGINKKINQEISKLNKSDKDKEEYYATFSSQNVNFNNEEAKNCSLNAIFGGIKCDLTDSKIKKDIVINSFAIFGGITIIVPDDVNVKVSSTSIFGGVSDERKNIKKDNSKTVYINATAIFGGITIK